MNLTSITSRSKQKPGHHVDMSTEDYIGFGPTSDSEMPIETEGTPAGIASEAEDMEDAVIPDSHPSTPEPELAGFSQEIQLAMGSHAPTLPPLDAEEPAGEQDSSLEAPDSPYSLLSAMSHSDMDPEEDWEAGLKDAGLDLNALSDSGVVLSPQSVPQQQKQSRSRKVSGGLSRKGKERETVSQASGSNSGAGGVRKSGKAAGKRRSDNVLQSERYHTEDSGESSGVEVTSARKDPVKARQRTRSESGSPLLDRPGPSRASKAVQSGPTKPCSRRASKRKSSTPNTEGTDGQEEHFMSEVEATVVKAVKRPTPEPFTSLSTGAGGTAMSARDIIAQLRQKNMASYGLSAPELTLAPAIDLGGKANDAMDEDSDDDLADPSLLLKAAAVRAPKPPEQRRSSRQVSGTTVKEKTVIVKAKMPVDKSEFSLINLHKDRALEEGRGWFGIEEAAKEVAEHRDSTDEEQGAGANGSGEDSDSDLPDAPDTRRRNKSKSAGPSKESELSEKAMERVAGALGSQERALEAVKMAQEDIELMAQEKREEQAIEARRLWNPAFELFIEPYVPYETTGRSGYDLALCQGIIDGIADSASFPSELFSIYLSQPSTIESSISITFSLYQLVAHPNTNLTLANKALRLLVGLLKKIPANGPRDTDLELYYVVDSLHKIGFKIEHIPQDLQEAADLTPMPDIISNTTKESFTAQGRRAATLRLMEVLKTFIATRRPFPQYASSTANLLLSMAVNPDDHEIRLAALDALRFTFNALDASTCGEVGSSLLERLRSIPRPDQYILVSLLPFENLSQQNMVRSLCFAILFNQTSLHTPTLSQIQPHLQDPPKTSIFYIPVASDEEQPDPDDTCLFYSVLLLQLLLSDIPKYLSADPAGDESSKIGHLRDLVRVLQNLDSKIRTDVRAGNPMRNKAKNALTRLQHSLEYQLNVSAKRVNANIKKQAMEKGHTADASGQMSLAGFFKPRVSTPVPS